MTRDKAVDEAIRWAVKLGFNTPTPSTKQAFERWFAADPAHRVAWTRVQDLNATLTPAPAAAAVTAQTIRQAAQARRTRRRMLSWLVVGSATGAVGWTLTGESPWLDVVADASTRTGEQKRLSLTDGSAIALNTDTAVSYHFSDDERLLTLHRGEIFVTTGSDQRAERFRPFRVRTRDGALTALGTRFNVRLYADDTVLHVEEGSVEMRPKASSERLFAHAGDGWRMKHDALSRLAGEAVQRTTSIWMDGVIDAQNMRLADLLQELARYRPGRIDCDTDIADLRISGYYQTADTTKTLQFLTHSHGLTMSAYTKWWIRIGIG